MWRGTGYRPDVLKEVLCQHPDVAEAAVIGVDDRKPKGQVPLGLVVLKKGVTISDEELHKQLITPVRQRLVPSPPLGW